MELNSISFLLAESTRLQSIHSILAHINMSKVGHHWRMVLSLILMVTLHCSSSSAQTYSISIQNATFESGSIDFLLMIKITPLPLTVLKIMWYHSAYPQKSSNFYTIEQTSVTRVGNIGEKTSHVISKDDDQYVFSLVIVGPSGKEKGDYCCQIYTAEHEPPLFAQLKAIMLVTLSSVLGESSNFTKGDPEAAIKINISPNDTTIHWIKCFHAKSPDRSTHFYTFDKIANSATGFGELGTRTSHTIDITDKWLTLNLFIQRPVSDDTGPYCCQIDAAGIPEPITVVVRINMAAFPHRGVPHASTSSPVTINIVPSENQGKGLLALTAFIAVVLVIGVIITILSVIRPCLVRREMLMIRSTFGHLRDRANAPEFPD